MITPTVGRVVWYYPGGAVQKSEGQPNAALVACVCDDGKVNLGYFDASGNAQSDQCIVLVQAGEPIPECGPFCEWPAIERPAKLKESIHAHG